MINGFNYLYVITRIARVCIRDDISGSTRTLMWVKAGTRRYLLIPPELRHYLHHYFSFKSCSQFGHFKRFLSFLALMLVLQSPVASCFPWGIDTNPPRATRVLLAQPRYEDISLEGACLLFSIDLLL